MGIGSSATIDNLAIEGTWDSPGAVRTAARRAATRCALQPPARPYFPSVEISCWRTTRAEEEEGPAQPAERYFFLNKGGSKDPEASFIAEGTY